MCPISQELPLRLERSLLSMSADRAKLSVLAQVCLIADMSNSTSRHQAYLGGLSTPLKTIRHAKARPAVELLHWQFALRTQISMRVGACTENSDLRASRSVHWDPRSQCKSERALRTQISVQRPRYITWCTSGARMLHLDAYLPCLRACTENSDLSARSDLRGEIS